MGTDRVGYVELGLRAGPPPLSSPKEWATSCGPCPFGVVARLPVWAALEKGLNVDFRKVSEGQGNCECRISNVEWNPRLQVI